MNRRSFWKFLAAAPAAAVASVAVAKLAAPTARAKIYINTDSVMHNCMVVDADLVIAPKANNWRVTQNYFYGGVCIK